MKFLIIDDDYYMCEMLTIALRQQRSEIVSISNVSDGLRRLMSEDFDCVLVDLHMPGMDGLTAIPLIRELVPDIYVGIMTGDLSSGNREKALLAGADFFAQKPYDIMNIWEIVSKFAEAHYGKDSSTGRV